VFEEKGKEEKGKKKEEKVLIVKIAVDPNRAREILE